MKVYLVGGSVRDQLLGVSSQDHDYLVVGSSPQQMLDAGYLPVGKDFPVFLHPGSHDEYALARTERKTAPGYSGFVFHTASDVTVEQDLARRDLTINAMARAEDGELIDPFGGQRDLADKVLRHVSAAFEEDPVRILRLARFAARMPGFVVAEETMALMRRMVQAGEVNALVAERVWQELARGLLEAQPERMFQVLQACDALPHLLPELLQAEPIVWQALRRAVERQFNLEQRFAVLLHQITHQAAIRALCERLKVPCDCRDLLEMLARELQLREQWSAPQPEQWVNLMQRCDAWRKPQRFEQFLQAVCAIFPWEEQMQRLRLALNAAKAVDAGAIAKNYTNQPRLIASAIFRARVDVVAALIAGTPIAGTPMAEAAI
jgi:tRNA nucleotidyltransferase (CCA-adding enzyme)